MVQKWLAGDDSQGAGWTGAKGDGETVGHESGRKIVEILESKCVGGVDTHGTDSAARTRTRSSTRPSSLRT